MYSKTLQHRKLATMALAAFTLISPTHSAATNVAQAQPTQPNILLLVAEDLGPRIGSYGDTVAHTPNLDELASNGARFTQVFTTAGVCAPSRAALITGQHQISFGAQNMRTSTGPLGPYLAQPPESLRAFPEILRSKGYFTFTDRKLDYQFSGVYANSGPFTLWDSEGDLGKFPQSTATAPWHFRAKGQPFFGFINFLETHESGVMRARGKPHSPVHANTQKFRLALGLVAPSSTDPSQIKLPPYYPDLPEVRQDIARHYDNIRAMDAKVGAILAALEKDGLAESTIIIWTTDHGDGLPRAKRELLDTGIHVPMIIYIPKQLAKGSLAALRPPRQAQEAKASNSLTNQLISFVDLAPTILQLAGVNPPGYLHGRDFLQTANNTAVKGSKPQREYIYASRDRMDEVVDKQRAIRSHRYKYIRSDFPQVPGGHPLAYRDNLDITRVWRTAHLAGHLPPEQNAWFLPASREQLYDLNSDPHELNNLARASELSKVRNTLSNALDKFILRVGDTSVEPESVMRERFLNAGQIPQTPAVEITWQGQQAVITSPIGASIGYRLDGESTWQLYTGPIAASVSSTTASADSFTASFTASFTKIEAKSVRYGWQASEVVTSQRPSE
jgi:arylsulfatase A-like enzyme